jgi:excinuclease ABC subunit C
MSEKSSSKDLAFSLSTSLRKGVEIIFSYVKNLPGKPGVYRMLGKDETVLYVGKAKDLKKRVQSYTLPQRLPNRLQRMISETLSMEFMITRTEIEALLLEANLIKNLSPRYNILLKDSKDYAYLLITDDLWPQLTKHRGAKTRAGQYFGPFASTDAVNNTLTILHRIFRLRSCNNSFFASRKRPCLQYHIKRCSAPCVKYIEEKDYQFAVKKTIDFLQGKSHEVQKELSQKMLAASQEKDYEKAIIYRDQIQAITQIQLRQNLNPTFTTDTDIIAAYSKEGHVCIQIFFYRKGSSYGSKAFFPERTKDMPLEEVLSSFLTVFYEETPPPSQIFLSHKIQEPH